MLHEIRVIVETTLLNPHWGCKWLPVTFGKKGGHKNDCYHSKYAQHWRAGFGAIFIGACYACSVRVGGQFPGEFLQNIPQGSAVYIALGAMDIVAIEALLKEILNEVSARMAAAYAEAGPIDTDHTLAQEGLSNGTFIVLDYLEHNESKIVLEHLLYMVNEPRLTLSATTEASLARLCTVYGIRR